MPAAAMVTFCFPDEIPRKPGLHASRQQALAWVPRSQQLPPSPTSWMPEYPDLIPRVKRVLRQQDFPPPQLFPVVVPLFGWHAEYPTVLNRRRLVTGAQPAVVNPLTPTFPVLVQWLPVYPSLHWTRGPKAPEQPVFAVNVDPLPNAPSPDLAWQPEYPDQIWPSVRLGPHLQQAWASDRIRPVSPALAWQPDYPDYLWRAILSVDRMPVFSYVERVANIPPDIGLNWQTQLPDLLRRPRRPIELSPRPVEVPISPVVWLAERMDPPDTPPRRTFLIPGGTSSPSVIVVNAERVGWHTELPDPVRRPWTPMVTWPTVILPTDPAPVSDQWCVMLAEDVGTVPMIDGDTVLLPSIADEIAITPTIDDEEVC